MTACVESVVDDATDVQVLLSVLFDGCFVSIHLLLKVGHCANVDSSSTELQP